MLPCRMHTANRRADMPCGRRSFLAPVCKHNVFHGETSNFPNVSAYVLNYDADACIGCGLCVERCPMKAVSMGEDGVCVMDTACVACGQCALKCPASARILVEKTEVINELPWDLCDDFKWRAEDRMQKGYVKDFVGTSLDDNQADNDFAAKLEALRAEQAE